MDLKEVGLFPDQERHWYYAAKSRALRQALGDYEPRRILDVGAGSGFFARMLLRETAAEHAVCVDPEYAREWSEVQFAKPLDFRRSSLADQSDLVLLMDVLEHDEDDVALLRGLVATAKPRTRFVVSVPAFSWLWSRHDEFLEHRRRYTLPGLRRVLSAAGLSRVVGFYMFASVFPAVAVIRLGSRWWGRAPQPKSDLRRHHPVTNSLLTRLCLAECAVARHNRVFGLSVFGAAEKI